MRRNSDAASVVAGIDSLVRAALATDGEPMLGSLRVRQTPRPSTSPGRRIWLGLTLGSKKGVPMDDTTTDDVGGPADEPSDPGGLTRRQAVGAGAVGLTTLALSAQSAGAATNATASQLHRTVLVHAPKDVVYDLKQVQRIQRDILGQLGCRACCSGWTIAFPDEVQFVVGGDNKPSPLTQAQISKRLGVGR
jgi:hypothetical protein